ncbi:hypothetical protein OH77DRAFT_1585914 [Trametes cingulata]|nr:hypothetical protein OH77DRAFT_1585914 [Trametes cingulata]
MQSSRTTRSTAGKRPRTSDVHAKPALADLDDDGAVPPDAKRARRSRSRSPSIVYLGQRRVAPPPFNADDADLVIRTQANTSFRVHRALLALASPTELAPMINRAEAALAAAAGLDPDPFILLLPESDFVIETLLRFIYPVPDPVLHDLDDVAAVYHAAQTYAVPCALQALQHALAAPRFLDAEPVRVYALAHRFRLDDLARTATRAALRLPAEWPAYEEFDAMPAQHYHALLTAHRRAARLAAECVASRELQPAAFAAHRKVPAAGARNLKCVKGPGVCWLLAYKKRAAPLLLEVPTSEKVCSPAFVAGLAESVECQLCREALLHVFEPNGYVEQLRKAIDAIAEQ